MSNLKNKELQPLTDAQVRQIEYAYKLLWFDRGTVGNAMLWHDVIVDFLIREGYEIKKPQRSQGEDDN